jgi:homoserine O-succinyltransferase
MSLILPFGLPAVATLRREGIAVFEGGAPAPLAASLRPLTVALVNLMPDKPTTETQFARLLAASGRPVRLVLTLPDGYEPQTADPDHIHRFYRPWSAIDRQRLDGVIITGAPVEQ